MSQFVVQEYNYGLTSSSFIRLQSRCLVGLWSHLKTPLGENQFVSSHPWSLARFSSLWACWTEDISSSGAVDERGAVDLSMANIWQLAEREEGKGEENEREVITQG